MACKSCGSGSQRMGVCRVHELVNGNTTERLVRWCDLCKAYICNPCRNNRPKRALAAIMDLTKRFRA